MTPNDDQTISENTGKLDEPSKIVLIIDGDSQYFRNDDK